jgi:hypothetical protein
VLVSTGGVKVEMLVFVHQNGVVVTVVAGMADALNEVVAVNVSNLINKSVCTRHIESYRILEVSQKGFKEKL